ncbi:MAG: sugar transferase [Legionellales bacterium]|nr:sugar transferase [Legionellales bacterium]
MYKEHLMKMIFDLIIASFILVLISPFLLLTTLLIGIKLGHPIFFKQERIGYQGKKFYLYKFRTMKIKQDSAGNDLPDEERLSQFGQFLRKWSLDELPQLINVLKGEISLVGPRPLLVEYLPLYSAEQMRRHEVKPGITGWAQVNGRNALAWEEKFKLDVWYVDNHSFLLDIKILFLTVIRIIKPQHINTEGHVTAPKFKGNQE